MGSWRKNNRLRPCLINSAGGLQVPPPSLKPPVPGPPPLTHPPPGGCPRFVLIGRSQRPINERLIPNNNNHHHHHYQQQQPVAISLLCIDFPSSSTSSMSSSSSSSKNNGSWCVPRDWRLDSIDRGDVIDLVRDLLRPLFILFFLQVFFPSSSINSIHRSTLNVLLIVSMKKKNLVSFQLVFNLMKPKGKPPTFSATL